MAIHKVAVMGAGAIGSTIGAYLSRAGRDVTLIDLWPAHVEAMRRDGLKVTALDDAFTAKVKALHLADVAGQRDRFDAVLLSVKSYDTAWAATFIAPHLAPGGFLVSAQNGINEETIASVIGHTRTVGCVVTIGAGLYEPGHVTRTNLISRPSFAVGEMTGNVTPRVQELVALLAPAGVSHATTNLWGDRWAKLTINCMANPLAGITGLNNMEMRSNPDVFPITVAVAGEALTVAERLGVQVEPIGGIPAATYLQAARGAGRDELRRAWIDQGKGVGAGRPSLLQDILKGRRTEVDYLNGYVAQKGREVDVATPMNQAIVEIVKQVEAGALPQSPANLAPLTRHL